MLNNFIRNFLISFLIFFVSFIPDLFIDYASYTCFYLYYPYYKELILFSLIWKMIIVIILIIRVKKFIENENIKETKQKLMKAEKELRKNE